MQFLNATALPDIVAAFRALTGKCLKIRPPTGPTLFSARRNVLRSARLGKPSQKLRPHEIIGIFCKKAIFEALKHVPIPFKYKRLFQLLDERYCVV